MFEMVYTITIREMYKRRLLCSIFFMNTKTVLQPSKDVIFFHFKWA